MADTPPEAQARSAAQSDRRTMVIALVVMVALVFLGVGSAAIFARSACDTLAPTALDVGESAPPGDVDPAVVAWLAQQVGPLSGVVEVPGARSLSATTAGVVAIGENASLLSPDGSAVVNRVELGEGTTVGSGDTLYSLALTNELTGQVDALLPLDASVDGGLAGRTCVDTALVGSPLAFHLSAGGGELLLLRVEDDGEDAEIELRDPVAGAVWSQAVASSLLPPGVLGEWMSGTLGPDLAVVGRRTAPGDASAVVTAFGRRDGEVRWTLSRDALGSWLATQRPQRVEVLGVTHDVVLVGLVGDTDDTDEGTGGDTDANTDGDTGGDGERPRDRASHLLALRAADGSPSWSLPIDGQALRAAAVDQGSGWAVVGGADDALRIVEVDAAGAPVASADLTGAHTGVHGAGVHGGLAVVGGQALLAHGGGFVSGTATGLATLSTDALIGLDAVAFDDDITVLVATGDGREFALTFGP